MRALSVRHPWAWAILAGIKPIENRTWRTSYRGPVLIHAGKREERSNIDYVLRECSHHTGTSVALLRNAYDQQATMGAIIGAVTITDCVTDHSSPWFHGRWGFVLARPVRAYQPVPCPGRLGFFEVPADVLACLEIPGYVE